MAKEKHPILYKVIAGLIVAAILYVLRLVPGAYPRIFRTLLSIWQLLTWRLTIPVWLCLLLLVVVIVALAIIANRVLQRLPSDPEFYAYREDKFFGAIWRWDYLGGSILDLSPFCAKCDTALVIRHDRFLRHVAMQCEHCGALAHEGLGNPDADIIDPIKRQIDRIVRTGEYRNKLATQ